MGQLTNHGPLKGLTDTQLRTALSAAADHATRMALEQELNRRASGTTTVELSGEEVSLLVDLLRGRRQPHPVRTKLDDAVLETRMYHTLMHKLEGLK